MGTNVEIIEYVDALWINSLALIAHFAADLLIHHLVKRTVQIQFRHVWETYSAI